MNWSQLAEHVARVAAALDDTGLRREHLIGIHCVDPYLALAGVLAAISAKHVNVLQLDLRSGH